MAVRRLSFWPCGGYPFGRAAAILLAADGCNVVCVDLNYALAQRTAELALAEGGGKAIAVLADVTSEAACKGIVEKAISEFGRLDILVNNVGVGGLKGTALDADMTKWAKVF